MGQGQYSGTIAPAGTAVIDLDVVGAQKLTVVIHNTGGANPINSTTVEICAKSVYATDTAAGTAIGSIAAAGKVLVEYKDLEAGLVKLTLASTLGTDYVVEVRRGVR